MNYIKIFEIKYMANSNTRRKRKELEKFNKKGICIDSNFGSRHNKSLHPKKYSQISIKDNPPFSKP